MPETAAALKTFAELLDDDTSESTEDGVAAASATGAWEDNTVAVVGDAEDFGLFPAGQAAADTETAEKAKSKAWYFILSKRMCGPESVMEYLISSWGEDSIRQRKERAHNSDGKAWSKERQGNTRRELVHSEDGRVKEEEFR